MKSDIKKIVNSIPKINIKRIKNKMGKFEYVSFDVFDTLLKRDVVQSKDIFKIMSRDLEDIDFYKRRKISESKCREKKRGEISLAQIYDMYDELFHIGSIKKTQYYEYELELEYSFSTINNPIYQIYKECINNNKIIYIISDTYLPETFISNLLKKNGISEYKKLYVSSSYNKTKSAGDLFSFILEENRIKASELIHIGDSKTGDFLSPVKLGIQAITISRYIKNIELVADNGTIETSVLNAFINNRIDLIQSDIEKIGYSVYGPLLYSFASWIDTKIDRSQLTLFFARDCYVVEKAYRMISSNSNIRYFEASRHSLIIPQLSKEQDIDFLIPLLKSNPKFFTIRDFFYFVGLDEANFQEEMLLNGYRIDSVLDRDELVSDSQFIKFYNLLKDSIKKKAEEQYSNLLRYIGEIKNNDKLQVVDIGWRCTMQKCLDNLINADLKGYYFGVREDASIDKKSCEGFYLSMENNIEKRIFLFSCVGLIELFFSSCVPSTISYDNFGRPVYKENNSINKDKQNDFLKLLQEGALKFVDDADKNDKVKKILKSKEVAVAPIHRMGIFPTKKELKIFDDYPFDTGTKNINMGYHKSIWHYSTHINELKLDFSESPWKIDFLRSFIHNKNLSYFIMKLIYFCGIKG